MAGLRAGSLTALGLTLLCLGGCDDGRTRLVVRTEMPRALRDVVEASFEASEPGVDVRFDVDDEAATVDALSPAAEPAPFDVWWGAAGPSLERAARSGALEGWRPLLGTPWVIAFDRDRVGLPEAPRDWVDVLHHGWVEEVAVPDPARSDVGARFVGAAVGEAVHAEGLSWVGLEWLERLDRQVVRYVPDEREALRALRVELASLALLRRATVEDARADDESLHYRIPEGGTPVDVLGAGVVAGSAVPDAARRFLDHLASDVVLAASAEHTGWEPLVPMEPVDSLAASPRSGEWLGYPLAAGLVVDSLATWLDRWTREVRGRGK